MQNVINQQHLVTALRILVNMSRDVVGPSLSEALDATSHLSLPTGWVAAIIDGWNSVAKSRRYKRAYARTMSGKTPVRYLSPSLIPPIDIRESKESRCVCRLCGLSPDQGRRTWHRDCWAYFEPQTAQFWTKIRKYVFSRDMGGCRRCGICVDVKKWRPSDLYVWKRNNRIKGKCIYNIDHIVAIADGGTHDISNLQLLCVLCHKRKTVSEAMQRARHKNI